MKISQPKFEWDEVNRTARCYIEIGKELPQLIIGQAQCHTDDWDMCNEKTGCDIAYQRAVIKVLQWYRTYEVQIKLNALKKLYYSMNNSKHFNIKSYENKMLQRQIRQLENELDVTNDLLAEQKENLNAYLQEKEKFYQKIRSLRRVKEEELKHKANN